MAKRRAGRLLQLDENSVNHRPLFEKCHCSPRLCRRVACAERFFLLCADVDNTKAKQLLSKAILPVRFSIMIPFKRRSNRNWGTVQVC